MSHFSARLFLRMALIGVLAGSLGLAACGRKGPLDLPPSAATTAKQESGSPALMRSPFDKSAGNATAEAEQKVPDKPFILDPLLN